MKKKIIIILGFVIILFCGILIVGGILNNNQQASKSIFGISGYSPINFPNSSVADIKNFYKDVNQYASFYGIHTKLSTGTQIIKTSGEEVSKPQVLVIDYEAAENVDLIIYALKINVKIKYLGIGNEVNLLNADNPKAFTEFLGNYKRAYNIIKNEFKDIKVFTVFQYEALVGKGKMTGKKYSNNIELINQFENKLDLIAVSLYPHFDYNSPKDIPENYLGQLENFNLPIAVTETSWPSGITSFSKELLGLNTSEDEQAEYIQWLDKLDKSNIEFINWLFLNDIDFNNAAFTGSALKDSEGKNKLGFLEWQNLVN